MAEIFTRHVVKGQVEELVEVSSLSEALQREADDSSVTSHTVLVRPNPVLIAELADAWDLHPMLTEDLLQAGQRPKLERYGDVLSLVLRSAHYVDELEEVLFSEFHLLVKSRAVLIVCQDGRLIDGTEIPDDPNLAAQTLRATALASVPSTYLKLLGTEGVVYRLIDAVVDSYSPTLDGLQYDREQIERQVFSGDAAAAERIYLLSREVIDVLHATTALTKLVQGLRNGADKYAIPDELQTYLEDVADHLAHVLTETIELKDALSQILNVNGTLVAQRQNEDMKKISGWAAILFTPTLIGAIYGMNFDSMPELHWALGYPLALMSMVGLGTALWVVFKRKKWM
ncbi:magnesium and cobalt transport protein CorA [Leucobacter coleopterorum]|uniref:Magnesium and cobalt transport protein CorA n=1 Tax=Leucobacter coleopterorum TaxID=2714933 RepID=A0ABX6JVU0_9MICO|nr:magnesium and cobalt transport protein CorA [Leucobacter coleopterorum]QIM18415.1 magnesium and cobalt transport protein CorA [Leucobacter coleopterorum]